MLHFLIAGLVLISSSQTTTTTAAHGRFGPQGGGAIYKVSVQVQHESQRAPVTAYRVAQARRDAPWRYCTFWYNNRQLTVVASPLHGCLRPPIGLPGILFY